MILVDAYYFLFLIFIGFMAYQDYRTRSVSNPVILVFYALLLPALTMNYTSLTIYHVVIILAVVALYLANLGMGEADLKMLVPFVLTLSEGMMYLFIYFTLVAAFALVVVKNAYKDKERIPGMVAICAGYAVVFGLRMI